MASYKSRLSIRSKSGEWTSSPEGDSYQTSESSVAPTSGGHHSSTSSHGSKSRKGSKASSLSKAESHSRTEPQSSFQYRSNASPSSGYDPNQLKHSSTAPSQVVSGGQGHFQKYSTSAGAGSYHRDSVPSYSSTADSISVPIRGAVPTPQASAYEDDYLSRSPTYSTIPRRGSDEQYDERKWSTMSSGNGSSGERRRDETREFAKQQQHLHEHRSRRGSEVGRVIREVDEKLPAGASMNATRSVYPADLEISGGPAAY